MLQKKDGLLNDIDISFADWQQGKKGPIYLDDRSIKVNGAKSKLRGEGRTVKQVLLVECEINWRYSQ